jgi:K(+)-stimulated pyrophosphate-energized sodium pump
VFLGLSPAAAPAQEQAETPAAAHVRSLADIPGVWWIAPIGSALALLFAWIFYGKMMKADEGDEDMIRVSSYVREGALAYLKQQYKVVAVFFAVVSIILAWMAWGLHVQHGITFLAFLTGGFFSGLCGWLGMNTATRASHRT